MSVSGDKTGIGGVWIKDKYTVPDDTSQSKSLFYRVAFSCAIKAPKGAQVSFEKNKQFIYWLRDQGFKIKKITSDTFQSAPVLQDLRAHGFDCDIQSVDRLTGEGKNKICETYHYFRSTIYDKRIEVYKTQLLTEEVIGLEKLSDGHVDHTTSGINSKDISDAVCGAVFEASKHAEEFAYDYGETLEETIKFNKDADRVSSEQIALDFEAEMLQLLDPVKSQAQEQEKQQVKLRQPSSYVYDNIIIW